MSKKKELAKNTIVIFIGKIFTQFITFLLLPLYTSYLITAEYGVVDLILSYISLCVPVILLQLDITIFRYLIDSRKDDVKKNEVITTAFWNILKSVFITTLIYLVIIQFIDFEFKYYIILCVIANILSSCMLQIARGLGKTINYAIAAIILGIITVILNVYFIVFLNLGSLGLLLALIIAHIVASIYLFIILNVKNSINKKYYNRKLSREMLHYALPLIPNSVSWWVINISDRTIITVFIDAAANGIYAISNKFPTLLNAALGVFSMSWTESASLHINSKERDSFFSEALNTSIKFFGCIALGIIACMPFIFPILIDSSYNEAYNYIPILILGTLFSMFVTNYSAIYIAKKLTKQVMYTSLLAAFINIFLNVLFINEFGLYAASISTVISYVVMTIYRAIDVRKHVNIKYEVKSILTILMFFIISTILYYQKSFVLDIVNLSMIIVLSIVLNKDVIFKILNKILKLKRR